MKCKDCRYCSQRGSYQYYFCDKDNELIKADDYWKEKEMQCSVNQEDNLLDDYILWKIARK